MVRNFLVVIFFSFIINSGFAQNVEVNAYTDTTDYLIGDYIKYSLQITSGKNAAILSTGFRDSPDSIGIDVISIDNPVIEEKDNLKITTFNFVLSRYDSAVVTVPPVPVYYRIGEDAAEKVPFITPEQASNDPSIKTAMSNPVRFSVHSMKVNIKEEIKDVKDPVTIPLDWKIVAMWILAGLIILALLYYLYQKYWKKKEQPKQKVIILPPHKIALNSLMELEEKKLWQNGKVKEYHSEITEIIRKYFEERYNLPALELTTSEAIFRLRNTPGAEKIISTTYDFLSNADLVKFAKYTPMSMVNEEMMKQANEIVNVTAPIKENEIVPEDTNV